ncbi:hypothetical protein G4177_25520 [Corallococcus sp. ZKHCc1 1396]|uniref:ATP-binding protein n=1 Tax=Corallococcus soli TaxID=2710757 RepID=A0ABR9PUS8_9BACT|nr:hypothetical protein [Corallococcus soli]MBE4751537.1 hypothetical protein [Corallococcus soli]
METATPSKTPLLELTPDESLTPAALERAAGALARDGLLLRHGVAHMPRLVLFDGRLGAALVPLLEREPAALLLATREPDGEPSAWEVALLSSLLRGSSLLPLQVRTGRARLTKVAEVGPACEAASEAVLEAGGSRVAAGLVADVAHELAANALLDAPVDEAGVPRYAHRRDQVREVAPEDACLLEWGVGEGRAWVQGVDRFGRLKASPLIRVLRSWGGKAQVDASGGGAGLGLRRILEHSDAVAVRVVPGRATEFACAVDLGEARRRAAHPKSLLFCLERG